jgi:hypothetical protein
MCHSIVSNTNGHYVGQSAEKQDTTVQTADFDRPYEVISLGVNAIKALHRTQHLECVCAVRQKARTQQDTRLADLTRDRTRRFSIIALRTTCLRAAVLSGRATAVRSGARFTVAIFCSGCDKGSINITVNAVPVHVSIRTSSKVTVKLTALRRGHGSSRSFSEGSPHPIRR